MVTTAVNPVRVNSTVGDGQSDKILEGSPFGEIDESVVEWLFLSAEGPFWVGRILLFHTFY